MKNKVRIAIPVILIIISGLLIYFRTEAPSRYVPKLNIMGDVEKPYIIEGYADFKLEKIKYNDEKIKVIKLSDIINLAEPSKINSNVMIVGDDGKMAEIHLSSILQSYIYFSQEDGWQAINLAHPTGSNLKNIKEIVVVSNDENYKHGINVFNDDGNLLNITAGKLYKENFMLYKRYESTSEMQSDSNRNKVTMYSTENLIKLKDLLANDTVADVITENVTLILESGKTETVSSDIHIQIGLNSLSCLMADMKTKVENVKGIYMSNKFNSITNAYDDALSYLEKDKKVMIIMADGFGYSQYRIAEENKYATVLSRYFKNTALSAYVPRVNTGYAAVVTGTTPDVNGIHDKNNTKLNVDSIFKKANDMGKKSLVLGGDTKILDMETEPVLHTDLNNNNETDDELFEKALAECEKDYDIIFINFSEIGKKSNACGPTANETMSCINKLNNYVESLRKVWGGNIIITSGYGVHKVKDGGSSGDCLAEDMVVPYFSIGR